MVNDIILKLLWLMFSAAELEISLRNCGYIFAASTTCAADDENSEKWLMELVVHF